MPRASEVLGRSQVKTIGRKTYHHLRRALRRSNNRLLGLGLRQSLRLKLRLTRTLPTGAHRSFASTCQPIDPLRAAKPLPAIDVAVPFVEKDLPALHLVIEGVYSSIRNPIANLFLVTPGDSLTGRPRFSSQQSHNELADVLVSFPNLTVRFDRDVLGAHLASELLDKSESKPGGWHLQQVLKYALARSSAQAATLIVDADTVLLSRKTWLGSDGLQLLQFSEEFHQPYMNHFQGFFGLPKDLPVSFVTHHQLMQTDVVNEMFPTEDALVDWLSFGLAEPDLKVSEYETYGSFLLAKHPRRAAFGTWSNLWSPHLELAKGLADSNNKALGDLLPDYCSVSFHSHSQKVGAGPRA